MRRLGMLLMAAGFAGFLGCAKKSVTAYNGQKIEAASMTLEASYDPALDALVPGYKIVTVAIRNHGYSPFVLDPVGDEWILVDGKGWRWKAYSNLRDQDADAWIALDIELRHKLSHPLIIPNGEVETVDLFLPTRAALEGFRSVTFKSRSLGMSMRIQTAALQGR